jgi:hypothetical protein
MFQVLHHDVVCLSHDPSHLLDKLPAIFDWTRLGVFTGSRLGEYGQSKPHKGELFAKVPDSADAGVWANTPLAFIRSDFTFSTPVDAPLLKVTSLFCIAMPWKSTSVFVLTKAI